VYATFPWRDQIIAAPAISVTAAITISVRIEFSCFSGSEELGVSEVN
jgi:hypothetical protein